MPRYYSLLLLSCHNVEKSETPDEVIHSLEEDQNTANAEPEDPPALEEDTSSESEDSDDTGYSNDTGNSDEIEDTDPPNNYEVQLVYAVDIPTAVPSSGTAGSVIILSEVAPSGTIADINAVIDLEHTCTKDLSGTLISPSGTEILLFDFSTWPVCSSNLDKTTFDDEATVELFQSQSPFTGPHRAIDDLSVFDGEDALGEWTLFIEDDTIGDSGQLILFYLEISFY